MQNASHISQVVHARTAAAARSLFALGSGLVLACVMAASGAQAQETPQPRPERPQPQREVQQREAQRDLQREMQRQEMHRQEQARQEMQREQRAYEEQQRRILQAQQEQQEQQEGQRRHGRMTADERSELRRQINEANQDIYARPRGRR
ncbi:hypothetical protein [Pseudoduganella sp. GCM10020061]|uniref:hypothetical protein n=1 Tax=Pseudoduganella sp. GCM10020061 TaxID=3317345 RepID=UPI00362D3669